MQQLRMRLQRADRQQMQGCQHNADREAELKVQSARLSTSEFIRWVWHKYPLPFRFEQNQFGRSSTGATKKERGLVREALLYHHSDKYTMSDDRVKIIASAVCQILTGKL